MPLPHLDHKKNRDNNDHCFIKKRNSTVKFIVQHFGADDKVPSLSDMEATHFASSKLGDTSRFVVDGMGYSEKPDCLPSARSLMTE